MAILHIDLTGGCNTTAGDVPAIVVYISDSYGVTTIAQPAAFGTTTGPRFSSSNEVEVAAAVEPEPAPPLRRRRYMPPPSAGAPPPSWRPHPAPPPRPAWPVQLRAFSRA